MYIDGQMGAAAVFRRAVASPIDMYPSPRSYLVDTIPPDTAVTPRPW